jgi:hypothetical protein
VLLFGLPLGIVLGRWLWTLFARGIYAVPDPATPVFSIVLVGLGALVFANLAAALPGPRPLFPAHCRPHPDGTPPAVGMRGAEAMPRQE